MLKRDTSGLKEHAQNKRNAAFERAEEAISQLVNEGRPVNFEAVAEEAGVSRTWLYKQPAIKAKISELRDYKHLKRKKAVWPATNEPTDATTIEALKNRIEKLEAENRGMRQLLEVVHGMSDLQLIEVIQKQQQRIEELTKLLAANREAT